MDRRAAAAAAAADNAGWCDAVCRTHGLEPRRDGQAWWSPARTPTYYPDAVTVSPDVDAASLLARLDATAGCSVKDSFATLDLAPFGFEVLFDAEWIVAAGGRRTADRWEAVTDVAGFEAWERAWRGHDDAAAGVLLPALLDSPSVTVLAAPGGGGGAVLTENAGGVVGVSNVFAAGGAMAAAYAACAAVAVDRLGATAVVGYARGDELAAARAAGFTPTGPLRVWQAF